jgi:hypothetical protein
VFIDLDQVATGGAELLHRLHVDWKAGGANDDIT